MTVVRRSALTLFAAPLALALAACGGGGEEGSGNGPSGEPLPTVAAPAGTSWVETAAETPEGGFRIGNPNAPLKLVEYASHTCSHCAEFSRTSAAELEEYVASGRVSYEIRNMIFNPIDLTIAILARCGGPTTFHPLANQAWQNFDALMGTVQNNSAALEQASQAPPAQRFQAIAQSSGLLDFFAERGISRDQAMQCLADQNAAQQIATRSQQQAEELEITGTPTFILNGTKLPSATWGPNGDQPGLEAALQQAGAR
jgi:protein-disulfide isomerase